MCPQIVPRCAIVLLAWSLPLSPGCASKSKVAPSTGPRTPTTADQVKIYEKAPKKYEVLGAVTVAPSATVRWDERGNADAGFEQLKAQAATRGANGLLLQAESGSDPDGFITAGYKGTYYQVPVRDNPKSAMAQAIWVLKE